MARSGWPSSSIGLALVVDGLDGAVGEHDLARPTGAVAHRVVDQPLDLEPVERLVLEQRPGDGLEAGAVPREHAASVRSSCERRMRSTSSSMTRAVSSE